MTSIEMTGFSISLIRLHEEPKGLLGAKPTSLHLKNNHWILCGGAQWFRRIVFILKTVGMMPVSTVGGVSGLLYKTAFSENLCGNGH